jgi:hypothetical protein
MDNFVFVNNLNEITEPYAGLRVFNEDDNKCYRWDPVDGWQLFKFNAENSEFTMSAYDLNKQIIAQLPELSQDSIQESKRRIRDFCDAHNATYYMLLCRELNYYTVFYLNVKDAQETVDDVLIECAGNIGTIKAIDLTEDSGAIELWVTNDEDTYAVYFFPYDTGVILCG